MSHPGPNPFASRARTRIVAVFIFLVAMFGLQESVARAADARAVEVGQGALVGRAGPWIRGCRSVVFNSSARESSGSAADELHRSGCILPFVATVEAADSGQSEDSGLWGRAVLDGTPYQ